MAKLEDHKIIKSLEYASGVPYFSVQEIIDAVGMSRRDYDMEANSMFRRAFDDKNEEILDEKGDSKFEIRYEALMNYMEFIELQEARRSSKIAMWTAIAAILISIFVSFASLVQHGINSSIV